MKKKKMFQVFGIPNNYYKRHGETFFTILYFCTTRYQDWRNLADQRLKKSSEKYICIHILKLFLAVTLTILALFDPFCVFYSMQFFSTTNRQKEERKTITLNFPSLPNSKQLLQKTWWNGFHEFILLYHMFSRLKESSRSKT